MMSDDPQNDNFFPIENMVLPAEFGFDGDVTAAYNMRDWLTRAVVKSGAKVVGGGCGCGFSDIDVEIEGFRFNLEIRPLSRSAQGDQQ